MVLWAGSLLAWERGLSTLRERMAGVLGRRELKETSGAFLDGLLSGIERKTGWLMAEQAGAPSDRIGCNHCLAAATGTRSCWAMRFAPTR